MTRGGSDQARLERLTREFEAARNRLDGTLNEISDRTNPRRIVRRKLDTLFAAVDAPPSSGDDDEAAAGLPMALVSVGVGVVVVAGVVFWLRRRRR